MDSDKKSNKPKEQEAVFTTIVGGRPPGSGTSIGNIPRGIEVLVKKASVDDDFRELLLEKRAEAAKEIDLQLDKNETYMLAAISREQLEKIIEHTKVSSEHKPVFLGKVGKAMLAIVLAGATVFMINSCTEKPITKGISPDRIRELQVEGKINPGNANDPNDPNNTTLEQDIIELQSDPRLNITKGIRPDRIE